MSYNIDVSRGIIERGNFSDYLLYVYYFPKAISGPIEKAKNFFSQLTGDFKFSYSDFITGFKLFIWGYFLKSVIADRISFAVDRVYLHPGDYSGLQVMLSVIFFTFQLYTDFAGYTYMALGISRTLGIQLTNNFHFPLFSQSISEFWRRWHITLSNWLKEYIFTPLNYKLYYSFNKLKIIRKPEYISYILSSLITMAVCGIWHNATIPFLVWGLLQGFYMAFSLLTKKWRKKAEKFIFGKKSSYSIIPKIIFTFFLTSITFIFFKADSFGQAITIMSRFSDILTVQTKHNLFLANSDLWISFVAIAIIIIAETICYRRDSIKFDYGIERLLNTPFVISLILIIIFLGKYGIKDFLYFRF